MKVSSLWTQPLDAYRKISHIRFCFVSSLSWWKSALNLATESWKSWVCIWKSTSPWEWPPCSSSWWTPRTYKRADPRRASDLRYLIQFTKHKEDDPPMPVPMVRMFPLNETLLMPQPELREGIFLTDCNVISWSVLSESIANEFRRIKNHLQCSWVKEICMRLASHSIPGQ